MLTQFQIQMLQKAGLTSEEITEAIKQSKNKSEKKKAK
jgi:hypothetical protein